MDTFCNSFGLNQVVDHPTHIHNGLCHSLLVFMSNPSYLSNCQVISPLSNSDHLEIKIKVKIFRLKFPRLRAKFGVIHLLTGIEPVNLLIVIPGKRWSTKTSMSSGLGG